MAYAAFSSHIGSLSMQPQIAADVSVEWEGVIGGRCKGHLIRCCYLSRLLFDSHPTVIIKFVLNKFVDFTNLIFGDIVGIGNGKAVMQRLANWVHGVLSRADSSACALFVNKMLTQPSPLNTPTNVLVVRELLYGNPQYANMTYVIFKQDLCRPRK